MKKLTHSELEIVKSVNELDASQLKKFKELEEENAKLKKMYANLALDNEILREVIEKNSRAEWYYESTKDDSEVEAAIRQKAEATNNSFHMNFKIGVMETESKFCTRSPGVRHRTAISNGLTDRTKGLFLTPTFSGL